MKKPCCFGWCRLLLSLGVLGTACSFAAANSPAVDPSTVDSPTIGLGVGEMAPDFCLPDLDGKLHRLSDYRGKKVFLFHFASW